MPLINLKHAEVFVDGLDHPEGVALGPDGALYAGGEAGQIYRIDYASRSVVQLGSTGGLNLGLAHDAAGTVYVCSSGAGGVYRVTAQGEVSLYSNGNRERRMVTPNYPAFDAQGYLFDMVFSPPDRSNSPTPSKGVGTMGGFGVVY